MPLLKNSLAFLPGNKLNFRYYSHWKQIRKKVSCTSERKSLSPIEKILWGFHVNFAP